MVTTNDGRNLATKAAYFYDYEKQQFCIITTYLRPAYGHHSFFTVVLSIRSLEKSRNLKHTKLIYIQKVIIYTSKPIYIYWNNQKLIK